MWIQHGTQRVKDISILGPRRTFLHDDVNGFAESLQGCTPEERARGERDIQRISDAVKRLHEVAYMLSVSPPHGARSSNPMAAIRDGSVPAINHQS